MKERQKLRVYKYFAYRPVFLLKLNKKFSIDKCGRNEKNNQIFSDFICKKYNKNIEKKRVKRSCLLKIKREILIER